MYPRILFPRRRETAHRNLWVRHFRIHRVVALLATGGLLCTAVMAQNRGQLLYETHCIACHSAQMHWRDKRLAQDWGSLRGEVQRWQANAALNWTEEDVTDVSRYLNQHYYRFSEPASPVAAGVPMRQSSVP